MYVYCVFVLAVGVAPTLTVYYQSLSGGVSCIYPTLLELRQLDPASGSSPDLAGLEPTVLGIIHHTEVPIRGNAPRS